MLFHVIHEIIEQFHLLLQHCWVFLHCIVMLMPLEVYVVNIPKKRGIKFMLYNSLKKVMEYFKQKAHKAFFISDY